MQEINLPMKGILLLAPKGLRENLIARVKKTKAKKAYTCIKQTIVW